MGELFDVQVQEFNEQANVLAQFISQRVARTSGTQKNKCVQEAKNKLAELKEVLDTLEFETREASSSAERSRLMRRVSGFRNEVSELENSLHKAAAVFTSNDRTDLLVDQSSIDDDDMTGSDQRQLLMRDTERLHETGMRISEAERQTLEMQAVGIEILDNLNTQRETINHARGTLGDTDANLRKSMRVANAMAQRVRQNKCLMYVIVITMVALIFLVMYLKWGK